MELSDLQNLTEKEILLLLWQDHKALNKALVDHMKQEEVKFAKIEKEQKFIFNTLIVMGFVGIAAKPELLNYTVDLITRSLR